MILVLKNLDVDALHCVKFCAIAFAVNDLKHVAWKNLVIMYALLLLDLFKQNGSSRAQLTDTNYSYGSQNKLKPVLRLIGLLRNYL